jgi:signal transduction histidine kinase
LRALPVRVRLLALSALAVAFALWLFGRRLGQTGSVYLDLTLAAVWAVSVGASETRWRGVAVATAFAAAAVSAHLSQPLVGLLLVSLGFVGSATPWRLLPWLGLPAVLVAAAATLSVQSSGVGPAVILAGRVPTTVLLVMPVMVLAGRVLTDRRQAVVAQAQALSDLGTANRELQQRAMEARELAVLRERTLLARELHDTLGHALSAITVEVEAARRVGRSDPDRVDAILLEVQSVARTAMGDLRAHLSALSEPRDAGDVADALRTLAVDAARRNDWLLDLQLEPVVAADPVRHALLQIGREALTNAERHARARSVAVALRNGPEGVRLAISDDGRGFDIHERRDGHLGLAGMRERVREAGGTLSVHSGVDTGTQVTVVVPAERPPVGGA